MKKYGVSILVVVLGICLAGQAGVVAYYSFDNPADLTVDDSGNGHTLTVFSGYGTPTYDAVGKYGGGGCSFNGIDQGWFIENNIYPTGAFTFSAWLKPSGTVNMIAQPWGLSSGFDVYVAAGKYRFLTRYAGGYSYRVGSVGPTNGVWQHIAMTYDSAVDGGTIKGYLNGELIAMTTNAQYAAETFNDMAIGKRSVNVFTGLMDEIYLHDTALTQEEIQTLMLPGPDYDWYQDWANSYGLPAGDDARDADPDQDGMENLLEYALGGDPKVDDSDVIQPSWNSGAGGFVYVYNRRLDADRRGLDYGVLQSDNLMMGWVNIGTNAEIGVGTIDADFESVTNAISSVDDQGYVSLEVVEN